MVVPPTMAILSIRVTCAPASRAATAADDQHFRVPGFSGLFRFRRFHGSLVSSRIKARSYDRGFHSRQDAIAGQGRARHSVHFDTVGFNDPGRNRIDRGIADPRVIAVFGDLDGLDHTVIAKGDRYFDGVFTVLARAGAHCGNIRQSRDEQGGQHHHSQHQGYELSHEYNLLLIVSFALQR